MLELAVLGAGIMGANHVRSARGLPDVRVSLVVDPDPARARALAEPLGVAWVTEVPSVLTGIDAAIVAAPTHVHRALGVPLLEAGIPVLMEKPIAGTLDDARALVDAAAAAGALLMVGHVEQFNAAILALDQLLSGVVHIHADRLGPYSGRVHEGVISDLMIHDLEIVQRIAASPVETVQAVSCRVRSSTEDLASALIGFASGLTATITASRIGQQKIRRLEITEAESFVSVDLLRQDVTVHRASRSEFLSSEGATYRQSGVIEIPFIEHRGEPLALELEHFVDCVRTSSSPRVGGEDGLAALELALLVERAASDPRS